MVDTKEHISNTLRELASDLAKRKDKEVSELAYVLPQYVTDHHDSDAYRDIDRQVNALAKAFDRMVALLEKTAIKAEAIESSVAQVGLSLV